VSAWVTFDVTTPAVALTGFASENWVFVVAALIIAATITSTGVLYRFALESIAHMRGGFPVRSTSMRRQSARVIAEPTFGGGHGSNAVSVAEECSRTRYHGLAFGQAFPWSGLARWQGCVVLRRPTRIHTFRRHLTGLNDPGALK
jgi:hypothetical protein